MRASNGVDGEGHRCEEMAGLQMEEADLPIESPCSCRDFAESQREDDHPDHGETMAEERPTIDGHHGEFGAAEEVVGWGLASAS